MRNHQAYLEAPYAARDAMEQLHEVWLDEVAEQDYEDLIVTGDIDGIMDDENDVFTPVSFEVFVTSRQGEGAFEAWLDGPQYD